MSRSITVVACLLVASLLAVSSAATERAARRPASGSSQQPADREPTELERRALASRETVGQLRLRSDQIHGWLRDARRLRNAGRASCLDDTLSQSHAFERQGDAAQQRAERAAEANDPGGVDRELVRIQVVDLLSQQLLGTAQQCGQAPARAAPHRRPAAPPRAR